VKSFLKDFLWGIKMFPNHYTPQFNWKKQPMNRFVAVSVWLTGIYFLIKTYVVEKSMSKYNAVDMAHKKYKAHKNLWAVALHGAGSSLEISIGCLACCYPKKKIYTKIASALAINNILTGFVLTPGVFGVKHLTVPGFLLFGVLRAVEILRTLAYDYRNYPQAWILLQVGTVVRLLGYWILPFSSIDGRRGDLFTEPTMYSFNISSPATSLQPLCIRPSGCWSRFSATVRLLAEDSAAKDLHQAPLGLHRCRRERLNATGRQRWCLNAGLS
jgi:hypothetical protein